MSKLSPQEQVNLIGKKYIGEFHVFTQFVNAILKEKQKFFSFDPSLEFLHDAKWNGEYLDFQFAGQEFRLVFDFTIFDGKKNNNGSRIGLVRMQHGQRERVVSSVMINGDGEVILKSDKALKLPADSEEVFGLLLLAPFTPPTVTSIEEYFRM